MIKQRDALDLLSFTLYRQKRAVRGLQGSSSSPEGYSIIKKSKFKRRFIKSQPIFIVYLFTFLAYGNVYAC